MNIFAPIALFSFGMAGVVVIPTVDDLPRTAVVEEMRTPLETQIAPPGPELPSASPATAESGPLSFRLVTTRALEAAISHGRVFLPAGTNVQLDLDRGSEVDIRFGSSLITVPREALANNGPVLKPRQPAPVPAAGFPGGAMLASASAQPPRSEEAPYPQHPERQRDPYESFQNSRLSTNCRGGGGYVYNNVSTNVYFDGGSHWGSSRGGSSPRSSCTPSRSSVFASNYRPQALPLVRHQARGASLRAFSQPRQQNRRSQPAAGSRNQRRG